MFAEITIIQNFIYNLQNLKIKEFQTREDYLYFKQGRLNTQSFVFSFRYHTPEFCKFTHAPKAISETTFMHNVYHPG